MDRLALYLTWLSAVGIAGTLIVISFSLGYYSPLIIAVCVVAGVVIAFPGGKLISSWIKKDDPAWNASDDRPTADLRQPRDHVHRDHVK